MLPSFLCLMLISHIVSNEHSIQLLLSHKKKAVIKTANFRLFLIGVARERVGHSAIVVARITEAVIVQFKVFCSRSKEVKFGITLPF